MKLFEELKWRGLVEDYSSEDLKTMLNEESLTFYIGMDPTASSMHLGHFSSFSVVKRLADRGHKPIILVGGATGLIGDPRPTTERPMISKEELNENYTSLKAQVEELFDFEVVNNYDWSKDINFIDFLRDYGKYFNISYMLGKEAVKSRLDTGITYTEFSYMIMQALDFVHLYENNNCVLQIGGQDQWGNLTSGIYLARKKIDKELFAFTMPLITDKHGNKFGKSEGEPIWLDKEKTSVYDFYQFFINQDDEVIIKYLKMLSFFTPEEIMEIEKEHLKAPEKRYAQMKLAESVITFIHGKEEFEKAKETSRKVFAGEVTEDMPTATVESMNILDALVEVEFTSSKSEGRRLMKQNGIRVNDEVINDIDFELKDGDILRRGRRNIIKIKNT